MNAHTDTYRNPSVAHQERKGGNGFARAIRFAADLRDVVGRWLWRAHYREELEHLSEHQLRDMGLDRDELRREANKPFWRA